MTGNGRERLFARCPNPAVGVPLASLFLLFGGVCGSDNPKRGKGGMMSFIVRRCMLLAAVAAAFSHTAVATEVYSEDGTKIDLFGEVRTQWNEGDAISHDVTGSGSKIGVSGEHSLGQLTARGVSSFQYNGNTHSAANFQVKEGYLGLRHKTYGELDIGRKATVHDTLFDYDCSWAFGGAAKNGHDPLGTGISESLIQYAWTGSELTLMGQIQARSTFVNDGFEAGGALDPLNPEKASVRPGFGLGLAWNGSMGVGAKVAYTRASLDNLSATPGGGNGVTPAPAAIMAPHMTVDSAGLQLDCTLGQVGLAAAVFNFSYKLPAEKQKKVGLAGRVAYNVIRPVNVYAVADRVQTSAPEESTFVNLAPKSTVATYTGGFDYRPHKKMLTFMEFSYEVSKAGQADKTNNGRVAAGARYYF